MLKSDRKDINKEREGGHNMENVFEELVGTNVELISVLAADSNKRNCC